MLISIFKIFYKITHLHIESKKEFDAIDRKDSNVEDNPKHTCTLVLLFGKYFIMYGRKMCKTIRTTPNLLKTNIRKSSKI